MTNSIIHSQSNEAHQRTSCTPARSPRGFEDYLNLDDFRVAAKRHLPMPFYEYISGGTEENQTLRANRSVFSEIELIPRFMTGVGNVDSSTELFGRRYSAPFGVAPMGAAALWAYEGDTVLASAAGQENVPMILSGASLIPLEKVKRVNAGTWFQMFFPGDDAGIVALTERVRDSGFDTLVITVDCPVNGNRENNTRAGFSTPVRPSLQLAWQGMTHPRWSIGTFLRTLIRHGMPHFENNHAHRGVPIFSASAQRDLSAAAHANWRQVRLVRARWSGKLIIKGLLDPRDAAIAADCGADGVIVSNHGGRQLDGAVPALRVLARIIAACPDIPVMMDGGIRRGIDVMKALAYGAKFVFIGRPLAFAASVGGQGGVLRAIQLLKEELRRNMALSGRRTIDEIDQSLVYAPGGTTPSISR